MATTITMFERNGAGTPTNTVITGIEYGEIDAPTGAMNSPLIAGDNTFDKYNYFRFVGDFVELFNVHIWHSAGVMSSGATYRGEAIDAFSAPSQASIGGADISTPTTEDNAIQLSTSQTAPDGAQTPTISSGGYSNFFHSQIQTTLLADRAPTTNLTMTLSWYEA